MKMQQQYGSMGIDGMLHVCVLLLPQVPEIAFTGDTSGELFERDGNADIYRAKLLIVECTFVDESVTWEQVRGMLGFGRTGQHCWHVRLGVVWWSGEGVWWGGCCEPLVSHDVTQA